MPTRQIVATYDYRDETGTLLFRKIRYAPKTFIQQRPDGQGGWIQNREGIRRVLYRLPDLKGLPAILKVEGEKDVDAAWALGIPATCNPDGATEWDESYAQQLIDAGVQRVAIIPDNDVPGDKHAQIVARSLTDAGLAVRVVELPNLPSHGDLSDYLNAGHTKAELMALVQAAPIWVRPAVVVEIPPRQFRTLGESRYMLEIRPEGVILEVNRLRRSSQELIGELLVRVNGSFPNARTFGEGILQVGDMNFSSTQARSTRAKLLGERAGDKAADWFGFLEEFVTQVIAAERRGKPAEVLADVEVEEEDEESWAIDGFPLLRQLPQVIFGSGSSAKSYLAMWIAGRLAQQDIPVLYADWEFDKNEHKKRYMRLFQVMPKNVIYVRCEHVLRHEIDHLLDIIHKHKIQYIICDSIGFACEGAAEAQEGAASYFRCLRQLRIGSLNIGHPPKQYDDAREAQLFGSVFYTNGARSVWYVERAKENPRGEINIGLYHRKTNVGALLQPKGFKLVFHGEERTAVEPINLKDVEELAAGFPLIARMKEILIPGPMTLKALAEELSAPVANIRAVLSRHKSHFVKMGSKIGVKSDDTTEF